jgi:hypothetical protein
MSQLRPHDDTYASATELYLFYDAGGEFSPQEIQPSTLIYPIPSPQTDDPLASMRIFKKVDVC